MKLLLFIVLLCLVAFVLIAAVPQSQITTPHIGPGGMVWPGGIGIPNFNGTTWGISYSSSNHIPANILGSGSVGAGNLCLLDNQTFGPCGSGGPGGTTRSFTYEDHTTFQGSYPVWSGTLISPAPIPVIDAAWGTGTMNIPASQTMNLTSSAWRVPTGYNGTLPVTIIFHSASSSGSASAQLQGYCQAATIPTAIAFSSTTNLGAPITLTPSATASAMVTVTNPEPFTCAAGSLAYINVTVTTTTTPISIDLLGSYPVGNLVQP